MSKHQVNDDSLKVVDPDVEQSLEVNRSYDTFSSVQSDIPVIQADREVPSSFSLDASSLLENPVESTPDIVSEEWEKFKNDFFTMIRPGKLVYDRKGYFEKKEFKLDGREKPCSPLRFFLTIVSWAVYVCFSSVLGIVLSIVVMMLLVVLGFEEIQAAGSVTIFGVILSVVLSVVGIQLICLLKECEQVRTIKRHKTEEMNRIQNEKIRIVFDHEKREVFFTRRNIYGRQRYVSTHLFNHKKFVFLCSISYDRILEIMLLPIDSYSQERNKRSIVAKIRPKTSHNCDVFVVLDERPIKGFEEMICKAFKQILSV